MTRERLDVETCALIGRLAAAMQLHAPRGSNVWMLIDQDNRAIRFVPENVDRPWGYWVAMEALRDGAWTPEEFAERFWAGRHRPNSRLAAGDHFTGGGPAA